MAGLYVHIPFCASRCIYCGFYSTTMKDDVRHRYVKALSKELRLRKGFLDAADTIDTIYIGGGTPSQLALADIRDMFCDIHATCGDSQIETTFEANPDDINAELVDTLKSCGVNRVSMGVQSFDDKRLRFLCRRHTAEQARTAFRLLRSNGFDNISIDLMFGFPNQTLEQWEQDIEKALELEPDHISAYSLMYEEGTRLHAMLTRGEVCEIDEETSTKMFKLLADNLSKTGYEHYEISNFAKPGRRAVHNSSYWNDTPYIGIGAAAHSYNRRSRQWNVADVHKYIQSIENGCVPAEAETIDADTHYDDLITTALRTSDGLDMNLLDSAHRDYMLECARKYLQSGQLEIVNGHLRIEENSIFVSDMIMSDLMKIE